MPTRRMVLRKRLRPLKAAKSLIWALNMAPLLQSLAEATIGLCSSPLVCGKSATLVAAIVPPRYIGSIFQASKPHPTEGGERIA